MKIYHDADGREYYLKEGEIHYIDDDEEAVPSKPRNNNWITAGIVIVGLVIAGLLGGGIVTLANRSAAVAPTADTNLLRTQIALEQTQTRIASAQTTPRPTFTPGPTHTVIPRPSPTPSATVPPPSSEALTIPFNKLSQTCSVYAYAGTVTLDISGTGQAGGQDWSDAFYLYQHGDGTPYQPPQLEHFDLEIDGQRAIITLGLRDTPPPFQTSHQYTVTYDVGITPRTICFRISDQNVGDNTGEFQITVRRT
jgi:hypothetical protein